MHNRKETGGADLVQTRHWKSYFRQRLPEFCAAPKSYFLAVQQREINFGTGIFDMTQQEAYKILGITEEEIEAVALETPEDAASSGATSLRTTAASTSSRTAYKAIGENPKSFDNAFQNFNRQAVERLIKKKYRQRMLSAHPDVQPEEETEYSAQQLNHAYAYLKKNGWYDGHVSKKSYREKSRAPKTQVWDAPVNEQAWREREIYSYAEDSEGERIGYFKIATGKYIWRTEEDFSLFQKSIFACASQILEEVERKKQIYKKERLRVQTLATLVYLLAQQFLDSTALLKELGQEQKADAEGNRIFLVPAMLELTGNIRAAEGEVISPKRLTKHRLYVKNGQGEELGYLSFRDDCMYYVIIPLMEQRRVKVRMKAAEGKKTACQKLDFYVKLLEKDTTGMPESLNLQIEQLLNDYTR